MIIKVKVARSTIASNGKPDIATARPCWQHNSYRKPNWRRFVKRCWGKRVARSGSERVRRIPAVTRPAEHAELPLRSRLEQQDRRANRETQPAPVGSDRPRALSPCRWLPAAVLRQDVAATWISDFLPVGTRRIAAAPHRLLMDGYAATRHRGSLSTDRGAGKGRRRPTMHLAPRLPAHGYGEGNQAGQSRERPAVDW